DSRQRLGLAKKEDTEATRVIVLTAEGKKIGCVVDRVVGVISIRRDEVEEISGEEVNKNFLEGIARIEGGKKLIMLLDAKQFLNSKDGEITKKNLFNKAVLSEKMKKGMNLSMKSSYR
ncbi:MAG: chemotaxis protein CheW, partial [Caldisericum exile]